MRSIFPNSQIDEQTEKAQKNAGAQISLRAVTGIEVASVILSVLITVWAIIPMQPPQRWLIYVPGLLALALIINSHRVRGESLRELGFTTAHFARAIKLLLAPILLAVSLFVTVGYLSDSFHRSTNFWSTLFFLPIWGVFQQYILQGFVYRRMRFLLVDENAPADKRKRQINLAIVASSAVFAFVHLPNPALTVYR
jgi:hypothetical protein